MRRHNLVDAQVAMSFMVQQAAYIETEVYRTQYPDITYQTLVPVDHTAPEWTKSITFFSMDQVGQAQWFNHMASDMRLADVTRAQHEQAVEMAGIGYRYTLEEIGQAMQLGWPLNVERANAAYRAYEEFAEAVAFSGDATKNMLGLINQTTVPQSLVPDAAAAGTDSSWFAKTPDEILFDINNILTGIYTGSNTVEMADTLLLPVEQYLHISTKRLADAQAMSILEWISKYNVYTAQTGRPLAIRAVRYLNGAGAGLTDRMVAYRRDPGVLKMHIPMPHRFLPVWQTGPITFDIPGIFRLGGVEVRRPKAMRYADGI